MDSGSMQTYLSHLYGAFMEAQPEARVLLPKLFFAYATREWATEVPASIGEQAAPAMSAMHHALERGDYAEVLAQLRVWAGWLPRARHPHACTHVPELRG